MSYAPGTILKRRKPFEEPEEGSIDLTPYNEVKVIGQALTYRGGPKNAEWDGGAADEWSISPTTFGEVLDRPLGELQRDYEIITVPQPPEPAPKRKPEEFTPGPSPEDVFRAEDKAAGRKKSPIRVKTPLAAFTTPPPAPAAPEK